jgi:hypothetical protein
MKHIKKFTEIPAGELNEGMKNWLPIFLLMANLGIIPPSIAKSTDKEKMEYISKLSEEEIIAIKFVKFAEDRNLSNTPSLEFVWDKFISEQEGIKIDIEDIKPFIEYKSGTIKLRKKFNYK